MPQQIDRRDQIERYAAGKKMKRIEYGIRYPDGAMEFGYPYDIETAEGRERYLEKRLEQLALLHQPPSPVEFVRRTVITTFTDPEPV